MAMTERRRYTRKQKISAVVAAAASSTLAAAEAQGIPESTLRYWLEKPEFASLREKTREEAADGWKVVLHLAQERIVALIPTMVAEDIMILAGIATDKSQLLSGEPTSREARVTEGWDDHERMALRDAIRQELVRRSEA
jgi:transposase-like protein